MRGVVQTLCLHIVNEPSEITGPLEFRFGIQPTPVKPMFAGHRGVRPDNGLQPQPVSVLITHASQWNSGDSKPSPRNWKLLTDIVALCQKRGQQFNPYIGAFFVTPWDYIRRDFPMWTSPEPYPMDARFNSKVEATRLEEYFYFQRDWNVSPPRISTTTPETREEVFMTPSSSYTDFFTGSVREMLERSDFSGFFFDISTPPLNFDEEKGLAYTTKDGAREGTFEVLATRDFYKRLYWLFDTHRGPKRKPWFIGHQFAFAAPYVSFWDMTINGEELKENKPFELTDFALQKHLKGNPAAIPSASKAEKSYDAFGWRSVFGAQFGVANIFLPQYGYLPELKTREHAREVLAITFVHDVRVWPAYIPAEVVYEFWNKVEIPFGLADATFHPYWNNGIAAEPAGIKVSYYCKTVGDDYLVAVANWSGEKTEAAVTLPDELNRFSTCLEMETGKPVVVEQSWKLNIPAHDLRVFRFGASTVTR